MGEPSYAISILGGTGKLGKELAVRWARSGYRVIIGSRSEQKAQNTASALCSERNVAGIAGMANGEAAIAGDVIVLTIPYDHQEVILREVRPLLKGKIVIDSSVPLVPSNRYEVSLVQEGSAACAAQAFLGSEAHVVSAFQNVSATALRKQGTVLCDVLVTGNDGKARQTVMHLVEAAGLHAWDGGSLLNSVAAEALTPVLLHINKVYERIGSGIRIVPGVPSKSSEVGHTIPHRVSLIGLSGIPVVCKGDNLAAIIGRAVADAGEVLQNGDILVVAQKIVSRAEGRLVRLDEVTPTLRAKSLSENVEMDSRLVELILSEASEVVASRPGLLIVAHRLGFVMANAGIDHSNVGQEWKEEAVLLLPEDPDRSALILQRQIHDTYHAEVGIIINDSVGRAWRNGSVGIALGAAGLTVLEDLRGRPDLFGRMLATSQVGRADEIAAAASLIMGQANEGIPVVLVKGLNRGNSSQDAKALLRPKETDLFR